MCTDLTAGVTLANLRKRAIFVASEVIPLFEIYSKLIYPHLKAPHLRNEKSFALSKPSLFIKDEKGLLLVHNFELYNILKITDISDEMLEHEVLYSEINADYFIFELAFYELIQVIARYPKLVNLGHSYEAAYSYKHNHLILSHVTIHSYLEYPHS